ncbi:kinesin-like protein KIF26A [Aplochiton taeniatus]
MDKAAQKLCLSSKWKKSQLPPLHSPPKSTEPLVYSGGFGGALQLSPPAVPPCLLRAGSKVKDTPGMGKVKIMVRICSVQNNSNSESTSFLKVDANKKQLILHKTPNSHSNVSHGRSSASVPKTFAFDAVFSKDASQAEVCSETIVEVIQSVVNGADGCILCFGHANLGKTYTMIGRDCSTQSLGIAPTAISWLFKLIEVCKEKAEARFSVRVSAVEISGRDEMLTDLLSNVSESKLLGGPSPGVCLREDPVCGSQLQNQTELGVATAERAASFLDKALAARSINKPQCNDEERRTSHFLFTLHVYQNRMEKSTKGGMSGGRSRLCLLDLGSCETEISRTWEGSRDQCLSLSALGNVVLALANGAKHVPYRDSKLTMLLMESLGNINCRTTIIAHISDSATNYVDTLTTVQLAARIHRMRKNKSKYASSSSGGESSWKEGKTRQPPHLQPLYPRTVAVDPDMPALSSDHNYSSSGEQSCDTVIYIGPCGSAISDRKLSDKEGPHAFVPIIPSLNNTSVKDTSKSDGDHFKCNTFAELQERLECIDGSEGPVALTGEPKQVQIAHRTQSGPYKIPKQTASCKTVVAPILKEFKSTTSNYMVSSKFEQEHSKLLSAKGIPESLKRTSADGEKVPVTLRHPCMVEPSMAFPQESESIVQENVSLSKVLSSRPSSSPSLPRSARAPSQMADTIGRDPPVRMSDTALQKGQGGSSPVLERAHNWGRNAMEKSHFRAALQGRGMETDFLRTTVTLQQPVELNGEDELVFTVVEDLPHGLVPDNRHPSNIISFHSDSLIRALDFGPVSIISSINDEFDAYTIQDGATGISSKATPQEELLAHHSSSQSSIGTWPSEFSVCFIDREGTHSLCRLLQRHKCIPSENSSMLLSPSIFHKEICFQHGDSSSLNDSGIYFSELDSGPATPNKLSSTKCPTSPDSTKASLQSSKSSANTLNTSAFSQLPHYAVHVSLPGITKTTSSVIPSCNRQENQQDNLRLHGIGLSDKRADEPLIPSKLPKNGVPGSPSRKPRGNCNMVPQPPKTQTSASASRGDGGCVSSSKKRYSRKKVDPFIKMSQLRRGANTLDTISVQHSASDSKWGCASELGIGSQRYASLGKRASVQKNNMIHKIASVSPPAPPVRKCSLDQKTQILLCPSPFKSSSTASKSVLPKTSVSEEESYMRVRADSFSLKKSSFKVDHGLAKTSSIMNRKAKGVSSAMSLQRCDSLTLTGTKLVLSREISDANLIDNGKSGRLETRLGIPTPKSTPTATTSPLYIAFATTSKPGQLKASVSSRTMVAKGSHAPSLAGSNSKVLSSFIQSFDTTTARNANVPSTGKPPARSLTGTNGKPGRGIIMGTKQAIQAANSRVSKLAAGSPRKQFSKGSVGAGNVTNYSRPSASGSPISTILPSPYSKITAPRRPQRYSSGHGSENSSVISGELLPAMGHTALFYHSGGSSGYESIIRGSETPGSASSAPESMSKSGESSSNKGRVSKSPKKRGTGFQRRRLIPAQLLDTCSLGSKAGVHGQWVDLPSLGGRMNKPFQIKMYEIDGVERLHRRRDGLLSQGLLHFNTRLRMLEKRQQCIQQLKGKHELLKEELEDAKNRLILDPGKWRGEFEVDQDLDKESQEYMEALAQATKELECCVNLCKSRVMMETCFDTVVTTAGVAMDGQ